MLSLLFVALPFAAAQLVDPSLVGTWSTKSRAVITGPGFYDPVNERFFEPNLTGISYSFTADGFYEEAYYRSVANPTDPACTQGVLQFQHGRWQVYHNGSLYLQPFAVDGRQLTSDPCTYQTSLYVRYSQAEFFRGYTVGVDAYHQVKRLDLFGFDGTPVNAMYLVYNPPQMLPTITLNPTASLPTATHAAKERIKRALGVSTPKDMAREADRWWWLGAGMTMLGAVGYFCF